LNRKRESRLSGSRRGFWHNRLPDPSLETQAPRREIQKLSSPTGAAFSITVIEWIRDKTSRLTPDGLKFQKRGQLFIGAHNETLPIAGSVKSFPPPIGVV
jgi:hypothetical protein